MAHRSLPDDCGRWAIARCPRPTRCSTASSMPRSSAVGTESTPATLTLRLISTLSQVPRTRQFRRATVKTRIEQGKHQTCGSTALSALIHRPATFRYGQTKIRDLTCRFTGGPDWDRTSDLPRVKWTEHQVLSELPGQTGRITSHRTNWTGSSDPLARYWPDKSTRRPLVGWHSAPPGERHQVPHTRAAGRSHRNTVHSRFQPTTRPEAGTTTARRETGTTAGGANPLSSRVTARNDKAH